MQEINTDDWFFDDDVTCATEQITSFYSSKIVQERNVFCESNDIDEWISSLKNKIPLSLCQVHKLCMKAKEILTKEKNIVNVSSPVIVCGDIHGQFYDLLEIFNIAGHIPDVNYVFMGDYVDRGRFSVLVISILLALKIRYPLRVTLLRGNHESRQTTQVYGFYDECLATYRCASAWIYFTSAFDCLPLSAIIDESHLCMHGGLSPSIPTADHIHVLDRFIEVPHEGPICDILWSDPSETCFLGFGPSNRGAGFMWGEDITTAFAFSNNLETITRAHQLVDKGVDYCHKSTVVTVFSAPNYCYRGGNMGGYLRIDKSDYLAYNFEAAPTSARSTNPITAYLRNYFR